MTQFDWMLLVVALIGAIGASVTYGAHSSLKKSPAETRATLIRG